MWPDALLCRFLRLSAGEDIKPASNRVDLASRTASPVPLIVGTRIPSCRRGGKMQNPHHPHITSRAGWACSALRCLPIRPSGDERDGAHIGQRDLQSCSVQMSVNDPTLSNWEMCSYGLGIGLFFRSIRRVSTFSKPSASVREKRNRYSFCGPQRASFDVAI